LKLREAIKRAKLKEIIKAASVDPFKSSIHFSDLAKQRLITLLTHPKL
jgi:hypothetical protein